MVSVNNFAMSRTQLSLGNDQGCSASLASMAKGAQAPLAPLLLLPMAVTTHAANRCVPKVEHSMQLRQLLTTSSCVDPLPNVVSYRAVYPAILYHVTIT